MRSEGFTPWAVRVSCPLVLMVATVAALAAPGAAMARGMKAGVPHGQAVVIGGIFPCAGFIASGGPRYSAGTVTVLKGRLRYKKVGHMSRVPVFPRQVAAKETVRRNKRFRFVLTPGYYVLRARLAPRPSIFPFKQVEAKPGKVTYADIPNMCM